MMDTNRLDGGIAVVFVACWFSLSVLGVSMYFMGVRSGRLELLRELKAAGVELETVKETWKVVKP